MNRNSIINKYLFQVNKEETNKQQYNSWQKLINDSEKQKLSKYAIYTSRTIAVKHPEVYLEANKRFYEHISQIPGYKNAFLEDDRESREFLPHSQYYMSAPFSFELFPWNDTKVVTNFRNLYPDRYPFLSYYDIRMMPAATILKTYDKKISELEMASLRFLEIYEKQGSTHDVFIIYSDDERAWIYNGGKTARAKNNEVVDIDSIDANVILIFNDAVSYYPLMDNYNTDGEIGEIVNKLKNKISKPVLSEEEELIGKTKKVTSLNTNKEHAMATIAAVRSTGARTKWFKFHNLWDIVMPEKKEKEKAYQYYGYLEQLMLRSNSVSPIVNYIATCSKKLSGYDKLIVIDREWVNLASLPNHTYVWGHIWDECLVEYIADDVFRTKAGHCMVEAPIISSILNIVGIDNYVLEGKVPGSHHYVYIPEYDFTFDNGKIQSCQNTIHWFGKRGNKVIDRIHYKGKFASIIAGGHYSGTFSPAETVEILDKLKAMHDDKILIYKNGEHEENKKRTSVEGWSKDTPTTEDYHILLKEDWVPFILA